MNRNTMDGSRHRIALIDITRGIAILLMAVYHFSWDLTYFRLAGFQIFSDPAWIWFAKFIASLILLVMGTSMVMARRRGLTSKIFFRRIGIISACAATVSVGTYVMDPGTFVFFGILHHIAIASILLAVVARFSAPVLLVLGVFCIAAPQILSASLFSDSWLLWLGLSPETPQSVDYVPLFPWFAIPLLGVLLGRFLIRTDTPKGLLLWSPSNPLLRLTCWIGRHSLVFYMVHQPVLFGGLYIFVSML